MSDIKSSILIQTLSYSFQFICRIPRLLYEMSPDIHQEYQGSQAPVYSSYNMLSHPSFVRFLWIRNDLITIPT